MNSRSLGFSFSAVLAGLAAATLVASCGGSSKKGTRKPKSKIAIKKPGKGKTEADYARERANAIHAIVPEGSSCLPEEKLNLQVALLGEEVVLCGNDTDAERALGQIACWTIDKATGGLTYKAPAPLLGRAMMVKTEVGCARGYCPPTKLPAGAVHVAHSTDGAAAVVVVGTTASIFDVASKQHKFEFDLAAAELAANAISGNVVDMVFVGDTLFVAAGATPSMTKVWMFKTDGKGLGPVGSPNPKEKDPISVHAGSLSVLDADHVGLSEAGMSALYSIEVSTGKRTKLVRKLPKFSCTPKELAAYWSMAGSEVAAKCKNTVDSAMGPFIGADFIAGKKAMLGSLRGSRRGELVVLDLKTLAEKTTIKLKVCSSDGEPSAATE
ncbi:MAG: hypothetical protein KBG15_00205 [Kofleriaceae bacterium]|nr:hypothetical protein [Kofleriaceae bacterium]